MYKIILLVAVFTSLRETRDLESKLYDNAYKRTAILFNQERRSSIVYVFFTCNELEWLV